MEDNPAATLTTSMDNHFISVGRVSSPCPADDGGGSLSEKLIFSSPDQHDCNIRIVEIPSTSLEDYSKEMHEGFKGENASDASYNSLLPNNEDNIRLWLPPEPEDAEDDKDDRVAKNDDDDDYSDGTKWGHPSPLSMPDGEEGAGHNYKEERQKVMMNAMNGQFKFLVSRFLASEGFSSVGTSEKWLEVVALLSWNAAHLVKPDANEGRAMDPGSYVKIKCVACGSRRESQVIKGLVFKKNAAHKHMPTKFQNPRLLLLKGVLGEPTVGLSSFNTLIQENEYLKAIMEMIETCNPNVVLVEKTVSRDVQEALNKKGITLVLDMKLPRLERIARCTGSTIFSSVDAAVNKKLRHCDSFHIEKVVEEHNCPSEGGKKPCKTLMFFEGCSKPLGCTILLKGANSDELKKVKRVVQYTVFAAYHLKLETSFFADQRAISFDGHNVEYPNSDEDKQDLSNSDLEITTSGVVPEYTVDIPVSDSILQETAVKGIEYNPDANANLLEDDFSISDTQFGETDVNGFFEQENFRSSLIPALLPGQFLSSVSTSLRKVLGEHLRISSTSPYESLSSYFGFKEHVDHEPVGQTISIDETLPFMETANTEVESMEKSDQEKTHEGYIENVKFESASDLNESLEHVADVGHSDKIQKKDETEAVLDPQSILVLFSSRSILKDTVCEQNHLSRIKYYGNFDMSLGRFLQDILLNQRHSCAGCGESPESHIYCYTHQNGKLSVQVRQLPPGKNLSGEAEGKIWMWTRCLKCQHENGFPNSSKRVVMSTAARGLSFGKFLELSFSSHSAARKLSKCGHLLHRDCLRFFGLGTKVAMFRYSPVEIYAACKPPPVLQFSSHLGQEWFEREAKDVLQREERFFSEVLTLLEKMKSQFSHEPLNFPGSTRQFSQIENMLLQEKADFEACLPIARSCNGLVGQPVPEIFDSIYLNRELLLELYVWDSRLHSLLLFAEDNIDQHAVTVNEQCPSTDISLDASGQWQTVGVSEPVKSTNVAESLSANIQHITSGCTSDIKEEANSFQFPSNQRHASLDADTAETLEPSPDVHTNAGGSFTTSTLNSSPDINSDIALTKVWGEVPGPTCTQVNESVSCLSGKPNNSGSTANIIMGINEVSCSETPPSSSGFEQHPDSCAFQSSIQTKVEGPEDWIWTPFSEIRKAFRKDYCGGYLQEFGFIYNHTPKHLSPLYQLNGREKECLCFPLPADSLVVSVREEEVSSIIACALAISQDQGRIWESLNEKEAGKDNGELDEAFENYHSLTRDASVVSSHWSSSGSLNLERMQSSQSLSSMSSEEFSASFTESLLFSDRVLSSDKLHPEIHVGFEKTTRKSKYSVVCIYAKQFDSLRRLCCPSEWAYISSLCRCKKWDAMGGKSKALFAKSLDDRFIIKQIKKTELESFLKFAPEYFKHVSSSISSGSQTCLAKILGVYQVRQIKNGKEVKTDLMVMENLLFGRNVSRTYDLKGAVYSRYVSDPNNPGKVLLDQNFVEDMGLSPMYVGGRTKHLLQRAIWNDTSFLTSINVMDYSLLVGVDKERHEIVFGIIDYLRQYTWDKQLETWVKSSLVVPKNSLPTVISPKEYKKRFRKFMSQYFLTVPDSWTSAPSLDPLKSSGSLGKDSCQAHDEDLSVKSNRSFGELSIAKS